MSERSYFLVADVMGFGHIVENSKGDALDGRIDEWVTLVEATAKNFKIKNIQLISDTLFASVAQEPDSLVQLIDFIRELLTASLSISLPLRGAIVSGECTWGRLTYGPAVIAAHQLEQAQNWIGIACAPAMPGVDTPWSLERLICYPVPFKRKEIRLHPVVAWPVPAANELIKLLARGGLTKNGDVLTWEVGEKINNTVLFGMYMKFLSRTKSSPSVFHGFLPIHPISTVTEHL